MRRWFKPAFGLMVSGSFVFLVFSRLSVGEILGILRRFDARFIPLALASLSCGYALRITRWWVMLNARAPRLCWREVGPPFLISIAANNVLPLRIGDVLRLFAFRNRTGLEPSRVAGTLLIERLLDLAVLLTIFSLSLSLLTASGPLKTVVVISHWAAGGGAVVAIAVFCLPVMDAAVFAGWRNAAWVTRHTLVAKLFGMEAMLAETIAGIGRPIKFAVLVGLSILVWFFEGGLFVAALAGFHTHDALMAGVFSLSVATLATLVPSSPGYVGTFHFFAIQAVSMFGIDQAVAAAFAIVAHLLIWLPTTLAGLIAFMWRTFAPADDANVTILQERNGLS